MSRWGDQVLTEQRYSSPSQTPVNLGLATSPRRVLVVLPGYAADSASRGIGSGSFVLRPLGVVWRSLTTGGYRSYVQDYRDFYANPRSHEYMIERVAELFSHALPDARAMLLLVSDVSKAAVPVRFASLGDRLEFGPTLQTDNIPEGVSRALAAHGPFDAAVLAHHDALGLGLQSVESRLVANLPDATFVINGRRRVYRLTSDMRRRLAWRRFLAETRIAESVMSIAIRFPGVV